MTKGLKKKPALNTACQETLDHEAKRFFGVDGARRPHPFPDRRRNGIAVRLPLSRPGARDRSRPYF
jgi:hypothetical protein